MVDFSDFDRHGEGGRTSEMFNVTIQNTEDEQLQTGVFAHQSEIDGPYSRSAAKSSEQAPITIMRLEVACYIAQMSSELSIMARSSELSLLSYFLDMAAAEARDTSRTLQDIVEPGIDLPEFDRDQPNG